MTRSMANGVLVALFVLSGMTGTLVAQGRGGRGGGGGHAGGGHSGAAPRGIFGPAPAAPVGSPPSTFHRVPGPGPVGNPFVGRPGGFGGIHHQPRVIVPQPYAGFYSPFIWNAPLYAQPAYVAPPYVAPIEPYYSTPSPSQGEVDLAAEVDRLAREVEQLRQDQALSTSRLLQGPPAPPAPVRPPTPITLVFRDGRQLNIVNYAVVGQTLWVLDEQSSTRIALSDLDVDATQKANPGMNIRLSLPQR